jgi:ppGpp synthetase/RelA/SpoT-type nucleotidyltranferase
MVISKELDLNFSRDEGFLRLLHAKLKETISTYCEAQGFVYDGRLKSVSSTAEKIESGRFSGWNELDDLVAVTIGVPLPSDEKNVLDFLQNTFHVVELKTRLSAKKAPDAFRFDATRFIGRLLVPEGIAQTERLYQIPFEIQVKTLFELAWSRTTHALAYKAHEVDWRGLRLAASLKASVEQMDLLLSDFNHVMGLMGQAPWPEIDKKLLLQTFMIERKSQIPSESWPKDLSRFIENCYAVIEWVQGAVRYQKRQRDLDIYPRCLELMDNFILEYADDKFPRSISLFQVWMGVITKEHGYPSDGKRSFPITEESELHFAHLKGVSNRFRWV